MQTNDPIDLFALLDALQLAVFVLEVGDDGMPRYVTMNKVGRKLTGLTQAGLEGKTALEIYGGVMGERALAQHLKVTQAEAETTYEVTIPLVERVADIRTTLTPVFNTAGKLTHLVGSSTDVTSERERDAALELTRISKEKAEEAGRAKERFLANMSHEIRTPMNGIVGMCDMLRETPLNEDQRLYSDTIYNSANALLDIVNDVLDFSKIRSEKIALHEEPFSLRDLVRETTMLLTPHASAQGLTLEVDYGAEVPGEFLGDATRVRQILLNLLGNAIKFTETGGVSVTIEFNPDVVLLPLRIAVQDTGPGIAPEEQKAIFSAFERVDNPVTRRTDGTGLGLAISQALAERMHGKIMVESVVGQGATFTAYLGLSVTDLPVSEREEVVARPAPKVARGAQLNGPLELGSQEGPLSGVRILVAEDNRTNQLVVQKMLSASGADLHFAPNGKQAVDAYQTEGCDVILMDLAMPVLGGLEATRIIRRFEKERNVSQCRIIALTANAQPSDAEACLAAGMDDFLSKPFRKKELFEILKQTV